MRDWQQQRPACPPPAGAAWWQGGCTAEAGPFEEELADLDVVHTKAERSARRKARVILASGFLILFTQTVAFIYLTWCGAGGVNQGV